MTKPELVGLTLDRLLEHFKSSPESFEYRDNERNPNSNHQPTIFWRPKVQLSKWATPISDPNNNHAVIIQWHAMMNELTCFLFVSAPPDIMNVGAMKADSVVQSKRMFETWRSNYRKFIKLKNLIVERDRYRENMDYLRKLSAVFPDNMDSHLLK